MLTSIAQATFWATSGVQGELTNLNDGGTVNFVVRDLDNPSSVTVDPHTGNAIVLISENKELLIVTPSGTIPVHVGPESVYNPDFSWPLDSTVDADGNIWVADAEAIIKLDSFGRVIFKITGVDGIQFPRYVSYSERDDTLVAVGRYDLVKYDLLGKPLYRISGFKNPKDIDIYQPTGMIAVADTDNSVVKLFSMQGYVLQSYTLGVRQPYATAFDSNGNLWVVNTLDRKIMQFSPFGQHLENDIINSEIGVPKEIFVDHATNDLFVVDKEDLWRLTKEGKVKLVITFDQPISDIALDLGASSSYIPTSLPAPSVSSTSYQDMRASSSAVQRRDMSSIQTRTPQQVPPSEETTREETRSAPVSAPDYAEEEMNEEVTQLRQQVAEQRQVMNEIITKQPVAQEDKNSEIIAVLVVTFLILLVLAFLGGMMLRKKKE